MALFRSSSLWRKGILYAALPCALAVLGCAARSTPVVWELEPSARPMYHYLVLQDAMARGDADTVLKSVEALRSPALTDSGIAGDGRMPDAHVFRDSAEFFLLRREFEQSRTLAVEGMALYPNDVPLCQILTEGYVQERRLADAAAVLRQFITANPDNMEAVQELGRVQIMMQQYREAEITLAGIPADRQSAQSRYLRAMALLGQDKITAGEKELTRVVAEDPSFSDAWINLAMAAQGQGQHAKAAGIYRKALAGDANDLGLWLRLVDAYLRAGQNDTALRAVQEGPGVMPLFAIEAAALFLDAQDFRRAEQLLAPFVDMPDLPEAAFYQAIIETEYTKDRREALRLLAGISPSSRLYDRALLWRADLMTAEGQGSEAMALMEELVQREPDNATALNFVGYTLADEGRDLARALDMLQRAVSIEPEDPHIVDSLAWVHFRMGNYAEAWTVIRRSIALGGDHPVIWEHYGDIAATIGEVDEARKGYRNALENEPENPAAIQEKLQSL